MAGLRRILGLTQRDRLHNEAINKHLNLQKKVSSRIWPWCLRFSSHVMRKNDSRCPDIALLGRVHRIRKRKARKMLDRGHKGRLWNLGYDNDTSI